jgi:hypothetical protein
MGNRYQHLEAAYAENQDVTITNVTLRFVSSAKLPVRSRSRKANQLVEENLESLREELASEKGRRKQTDLMLLQVHGVDVPISLSRQADRLGGLIYGLLRAEAWAQSG